MGLRFEANYNAISGIAPYVVADPLARWVNVHNFTVDQGYQANLLGVLLNVEPIFYYLVTTLRYGWMAIDALLDVGKNNWIKKFEVSMQCTVLASKMFTPRLVILPLGNGINLTAGQGMSVRALGAAITLYRWWACFVMDSEKI